MSILSKRIQACEINIDEKGRDHGDIVKLFELDSKNLIIRDVKIGHTTIDVKYDLSAIQVDIYKSTDLQNGNVVGSAIVGGLLFGGVGALVGALSGSSKKPIWLVEIVADQKVRLFKLKNDTDKATLEKYIRKHQ